MPLNLAVVTSTAAVGFVLCGATGMADGEYTQANLRTIPPPASLFGVLDHLREHPWLLARRSAADLDTFLTGWWLGRLSAGQPPPDAGEYSDFQAWVHDRFGDPTTRSWAAVVEARHGGDPGGWDDLFRVLDQWRRERAATDTPAGADAGRPAPGEWPMDAGTGFLSAVIATFEANKRLADRAVGQVPDDRLHLPLDPNTNSVAAVMRHVAGNLTSRWTDFLSSDGEKPWRDRDAEFGDTTLSRAELLVEWERGWGRLFTTLRGLTADDLGKTVTIRGVPHSVPLALSRSLGHTCYHVGQIVQTARVHAGENWSTLTIPRGGSDEFNEAAWGRAGGPPP